MRNALEGLRVLDFCWVGAGAFVTKVLAEHGAEVIKIESRARPDNLRVAPPFRPGSEGLDGSGYFASRNNDKKSFSLNMREPRSHEIALRLAHSCDLVSNNFRPGVMEKWGLSYADVSEVNPGVIYLSMPMQGASGPNSHYIGFGSTIAALSGLVAISGRPDRAPIGTGTHYPDHVPSPGHALVAVLAAIRRKRLTGEGCFVELSQLESMVALLAPAIDRASSGGDVTRQGNRVPMHSPSAVFRCLGDDAWCALSARNDSEWQSLVQELGAPELAGDARFVTHADRKANEDALEEVLAPLVAKRGNDELARALQARGVPAARVLSSAEILADEQLRARGFWRTLLHPVLGEFTAPAAPFVADRTRTGPERAAPLLGEHTRELASSLLALDEDEIDALVEEKVLW
jgi:benzylsuccinate CoA-transferase BbsF subunit